MTDLHGLTIDEAHAHDSLLGPVVRGDPRHLSWVAPTQLMNPTIPADFIVSAFEDDATAAASEFGDLENGLQWRNDIASYIDRETVEALIAPDRFELPPLERVS